ncbi:MAG: glycerol-3-phosphate acyltransferase [Bryobacterales bacterium]|nr:glycerol-3-phosphate acyltransferase [Bryobacterales bacterium]
MPAFDAALLLRLAVCYFIGSIPFAVIVMMGTGIDILTAGSGNPGFNNVLRFSKWRSVLCLIGDLGKGLFAIILVTRWWPLSAEPPSQALLWMYGLAAILGHCFSPWLKFNGGKGIATSAGVMLYLYPWYVPPMVLVYIVLRKIGKRRKWVEEGTRASLTGYALFVAILFAREDLASALFGLAFFLFVAWRHKKNFQNMRAARP